MSDLSKKNDSSPCSEMTVKRLMKICRKKGLYDTPEYNDNLYLNHEGFSQISNLEKYTNLKSLFLEGNALTVIENIEHLHELRGLYLQHNTLKRISGLQGLYELRCLDLSNNQIIRIENMTHLDKLETLNLGNNLLSSMEDIEEILCNKSLVTLNLDGNKFQTEEEGFKLIKLLSKLPKLKSLYLMGNPFIAKMNWYRKHTISTIRTLTFLDDRPVFENERRLNDAWILGGPRAEDAEKKKIQEERTDKRNQSRKIRREKYEARRNAMMKRLEREVPNKEMEEQCEESKAEEEQIDPIKNMYDIISEDSKAAEYISSLMEQQEQEIINALPGMVNTRLDLD